MTPLPKRRHSTRRGGKRHAAIRIRSKSVSLCTNCKTAIIPHRVCPACGYYNGKPVVQVKTKKAEKA